MKMKLSFGKFLQPNESRAEFILKGAVVERISYGCDNILNGGSTFGLELRAHIHTNIVPTVHTIDDEHLVTNHSTRTYPQFTLHACFPRS